MSIELKLPCYADPFVNQIEGIQSSVIDSLSNGVDTVNRVSLLDEQDWFNCIG